MIDDPALLRRYLDDRSEDAFTELVHRHLGLVYATALRRVGRDAHLAEDVAQKVFTDLARKAPSLRHHVSLAGWLFTAAHLASAETVRRETRRKTRETTALALQTMLTDSTPPADWDRLRPALDEFIHTLSADDREAVVLRYFQQRSFSEIGAALRLTEEAARKRVDRALEKLRQHLSRRGVTSTTAAVGLALSETALVAAPAGLATQIAGAALTSAAATGAVLATFLTLLKSPFTAAAALATLGFATLLPQARTHAALHQELARHTSTASALAALRAENSRLTTLRAEADGLHRARTELPALLAATPPPPPSPQPAVAKAVITLTSSNSILWAGQPVTLPEFLARLQEFHAQHPDSDRQLLVRCETGVTADAMSYVLQEARKAQITKFSVQGDDLRYDQLPIAQGSTSWF